MGQDNASTQPCGERPKLLDEVRTRIRACHLAIGAEEAYVQWIRRFILFHNKRHPRELGQPHVTRFLDDLAKNECAPAPARSQARSAISFLYREVLHFPLRSSSRRAANSPPDNGDPPAISCLPPPLEVKPSSSMAIAAASGTSLQTPPPTTSPTAQNITLPQQPKLLDRVHQAIRVRHYSRRTEEAYVHWIKKYIFFHGVRHPQDMGAGEVTQFLSHLAVKCRVSASTQNQAFSALLFLYQQVLNIPLENIDALRAKRPKHLPLILTPDEVGAVLSRMQGLPLLVSQLSYGSGMRLLECLQTRVKDLDFQRREVTVRDGKGEKDRVTMLPDALREPLTEQLAKVHQQHQQDLGEGLGRAPLPNALAEKYPHADREWAWQYVFPATSHYRDRHTGVRHRHHLHESVIQKAFRRAVVEANITKPATFHTLRHAFATELLANHYDIRTIQELLGHSHVDTTMIYTHVLNKGGRGVESPLDRLRRK